MSSQVNIVVEDRPSVVKSKSTSRLISLLFTHGKAIITASVSFVFVILMWQLVGASEGPRSIFLPTPGVVMQALSQLFSEKGFYLDVWWSIYRVTVGFLLSVVVAVPLGLLAGRFQIVDRLVQPINDFARYLPVASLIPLCILWVGIGDLNKILIIFIGTVFQLIPLVADTATNVPESLIDIARACGASKRDVVWKVVFPWCLPTIYDQSRVALGWAWSYLIVAELVATTSGIGRVIIQAQRFIQTPRVIAGIIVIGCLGLFFDQTFKRMKRYFFRYL